MADVTQDLNATIASAVQARVEMEVAAALSGSDLMAQYVTAALQEPITVRENYRDRKTTFLHETIKAAIREATKAAVQAAIVSEQAKIQAEVEKILRRDVKKIAGQMVDRVAEKASDSYGVKVELQYPER